MNIIVTGTSSGIGRELAQHLLAQGHHVWGWARSPQQDFAAQHPAFRWSICDVASWESVIAAADTVDQNWPAVDAVVACAGVQGEVGPLISCDPVKWSATVRANLEGTFYTIRALYPAMRRAPGRRKIVCFSGGGATKPRPFFSAYGVSKTAIVRLVETLAEELKSEPLDVNAIAPGAISTRLTEEVIRLGPTVAGPSEYESALKLKSAGGSAAQAIALVEWLLSGDSDGISGRLLSAPWDPWRTLAQHAPRLAQSDVYTLRRIVPEERDLTF